MVWKIFGKNTKQPDASVHPSEVPPLSEAEPEMPFGEDITNPDSRTFPEEFHGEWVRDAGDCGVESCGIRKIISSDRVVDGAAEHRVVAVRFIEERQVAVVTLPVDPGDDQYSLYYFGLSDDGNSLIDLESMDWVLYRCRACP